MIKDIDKTGSVLVMNLEMTIREDNSIEDKIACIIVGI